MILRDGTESSLSRLYRKAVDQELTFVESHRKCHDFFRHEVAKKYGKSFLNMLRTTKEHVEISQEENTFPSNIKC